MLFVGNRLKELRENAKYTQEELANKLGTIQVQVWRWETGKTEPSTEMIVKMAKLFRVTVDYLLGLVNQPDDQLSEADLSGVENQLIRAYRDGDIKQVLKILLSSEDKE